MKNYQSGFAEIDGARFYYEIAGSGPTVVLVHAGIADRRMWDAQFEAFAEHYTVVRYDTRGFGNTTSPANPHYTLVGDLTAVMDALKINKAALIGCSLGGVTVIDMAVRCPERISALIPVCPGISGHKTDSPTLQKYIVELMAAVEKQDYMGVIDIQVRGFVDGPNRTPDQVNPEVRKLAYEMIGNRTRKIGEEGYFEPQPPDSLAIDHLGEIHVPTLIIQGDQDDQGVIDVSAILQTRIPNAKTVMIPNTAHLPSMEQPDLFNRTVLDFLAAQYTIAP